MTNVYDYLLQLQTLTKKNLEILQTLNSSLTTNHNYLSVNVGDQPYAIPSFMALENKINHLQENFENLVNAPLSGEAYFNFDGNSKAIELRSYTHTPHRLVLDNVNKFEVEQNDIFKDFLTPVPYVKFSLTALPNDITSVNVKKVIPRSSALVERFKSFLKDTSSNVTYADIYKIISFYKEDVDYVEYDTVMKLPIRKNIGTGTYVIESVKYDVLDEKGLDEKMTIKFRSDLPQYTTNLTYRAFDETIQKSLKVGDELVTFDGSAKMKITAVYPNTNTVDTILMHGEYLNLLESGSDLNVSDYSKLRFFSPVDFDSDKYIQVPLEEDQYVFIAIAALNDRMNIQGPWGTGVLLDTYSLVNENGLKFKEYYDENVRNIGDALFEITSMMSNTLTKYSGDKYNELINKTPRLNTNHILVTQINKHLNESTTIKNIRSLYSQKKTDKITLEEVQSKINDINAKLATISFDDTSNIRAAYVQQLTEYNTKKNELITSITKTMDAISVAVNDSEIPIENAKYRIRGFFDTKAFAKELGLEVSQIRGIQVQYRYKNVNLNQGTAMSISDPDSGENLFIFSDWNVMKGINNPRIATYNGEYKFGAQPYNGNINEPSYNQIDIPISQGETVDIRLRVLYDFGFPFIEVVSAWSEIMNIEFPSEYLKDIQILDIINENNNDIETNRFKNILEERGVPSHIDDKIVDQDLTYFHKPENIASGFYTAERRIIPLKDKLESINSAITLLQDEVMGSSADNITVTIENGEVTNHLFPYQDNQIHVRGWGEFQDNIATDGEVYVDGVYTKDSANVVSTILNLTLTNNSEHTMKIYSMFPGNRDNSIGKLLNSTYVNSKYDKTEYCNVQTETENETGVWLRLPDDKGSDGVGIPQFQLQTCNQIITFRIKDVYDGTEYYIGDESYTSNKLSWKNEYQILTGEGMSMYPMISNKHSICLDSDSPRSFITIAPGARIVVPIIVEYNIPNKKPAITKTMSFDIRTSLYQDPINYTFSVTAKYASSSADKLLSTTRKSYGIKDLNTQGMIKYNTIVK